MTPAEAPPAARVAKPPINLLRGWPSPHVLPAAMLKAAADKALSDPDIFVPGLQYGPDPGYQPLREHLADFLAGHYGTDADAERICISGGASQSLACILQSFTDPVYTQTVWMVAPCYHLACAIFEDAGFRGRLRAVPEDAEGIDLAFLETRLAAAEDNLDPGEQPVYKRPDLRKIYRHVVYVVPTAANPSGKTMTLRRREGLVRLARRYDCLVVCDDVYDFLQWPVDVSSAPTTTTTTTAPAPASPLPKTRALPRLSDIDRALGPVAPHKHDDATTTWFGNAVSNGSFSKIIGPGIRTGWVEGTRAFARGLAHTGSTCSGGAASQFSAAVVCEMMRAGDLARHVDGACRPALRRRHALLMAAVHRRLDRFGVDVLDHHSPGSNGDGEDGRRYYGGYFVWLTFPHGPAARDIAARAKRDENLVVPPGNMFEVFGDEEGARFDNSLRLCFSWEEEQSLVEGVERLERVVAALWDERGKEDSRGPKASDGGSMDEFLLMK